MQWNPRDQLYDHLMMLKNKRDTLRRNGRATVLFLFFILNFCIVSLAFARVLICNFFFFENLFCKKKKRKYLRIVLIISDLLAWSRLWHRVLPPSTFEPGAEIISRAKKYTKSTFLCNMCLFTGIGQKKKTKKKQTYFRCDALIHPAGNSAPFLIYISIFPVCSLVTALTCLTM